jgi:2-polyprenyl-3-methyl-5-hydroxy-6-metoxy-1,4-benzoquinol methylase
MPADRTQGFFHRYAGDFDAIYSNRGGLIDGAVNALFRRSMKLRFIKSIEGCQPIEGRTVLDVGCGPGHYGITLARRGAARVVGLDFAEGMLQIAREHAEKAGVAGRCEFKTGDFLEYPPAEKFDYVIVMGFMDYMADPRRVVEKAVSLARSKAFFSFPVAGGVLAWQRRLRYRKRCDLYLYTREQLRQIFGAIPGVAAEIEPIARDFFVTAAVQPKAASQRS